MGVSGAELRGPPSLVPNPYFRGKQPGNPIQFLPESLWAAFRTRKKRKTNEDLAKFCIYLYDCY